MEYNYYGSKSRAPEGPLSYQIQLPSGKVVNCLPLSLDFTGGLYEALSLVDTKDFNFFEGQFIYCTMLQRVVQSVTGKKYLINQSRMKPSPDKLFSVTIPYLVEKPEDLIQHTEYRFKTGTRTGDMFSVDEQIVILKIIKEHIEPDLYLLDGTAVVKGFSQITKFLLSKL